MSTRPSIDYKTYKWLLGKVNQKMLFEERASAPDEIDFIKDGTWLADTAVIELLEKRNGAFAIQLLFAHYKQPLKLLIRSISTNADFKKAQIMSHLFRRQAAKDQRGTLRIEATSFLIDYN